MSAPTTAVAGHDLPDPQEIFAPLRACVPDIEGETRAAYQVSESAALDLIVAIAERFQLATEPDQAANQSAAIYVSSHLDSVPHGGTVVEASD